MINEKLLNFTELYFNSLDENMELTTQELEVAGIDVSASEQRTLELLRKAKAEAKIESGKAFKQKYYELLNNIDLLLPQMEKEEPELATAFRKLKESPEDEEMLDDQKKLKLLEYLNKKKG